ncbi:Coenzyme F420 hydrogenase/dehydrogenase, beta subunit C-terminal domain [Methanothermobacter sp.]|uniref:Coenzyme F420 hydrogenase/dehydrogenase, beta subunit C-terminal domain n=1 Tax=Methanothermobacter sp. TaxID=1884223 RepID=UPI0026038DD8|nr:Coenzyme F420 hydrogenase/dehydrogenase, beta subunit C-terminal domain [Methanothermobacter sp.]MDI9617666.1 Coenzyme F420 hydrogenase/dehydrogenase, beta subunit C-terminal domain [Methanothermobacter sp.]
MRNASEVGDLCTGCGTCTALCPTQALEMRVNEKKGVYEPVLTGECNECGVCLRVCPGLGVDFRKLNMEVFGREPDDILLGNYEACYVAHSTDEKLRYDSSSGGMVTQVLLYLLEEGLIDGALVTRMNPERPLEPEPFIARTPDEIIESRGSKYCPVPANVALREIIDVPGMYAVVGLPCHIHGIRKAELLNRKLRERIVYHLGILCNNTPNFKATEFLLKHIKLKKEEIKKINYRGKGWPGFLSIKAKKDLKIPQPEYWDSGFGLFFCSVRCKLCIDHFCKFSDASFGDYWMETRKNDGLSLVIMRKKNLMKIISSMNPEKICKKTVSPKKLKETQGKTPIIKINFYFYSKKLRIYKIPSYNEKVQNGDFVLFLKDFITWNIGHAMSENKHLLHLLEFYSKMLKILIK